MTSLYEYSPLDTSLSEIRLLWIPPQSASPLQFALTHVSLHDPPDFTALSYCWLGQPRDRPVTIDNSQLHITESLHTALLNIYSNENGAFLWTDAICINQSDDIEKASQIRLMRQIYSTATQVLIWLGPSTEESDKAVSGIREIGDHLIEAGLLDVLREKKTGFMTWMEQPDDASPAASTRRTVIDVMIRYRQAARNGSDPFWWVGSDLNSRDWFSRVWCIQECVNARKATLRCGNEEASYEQFQAAIWFYRLFCLFLCGEFHNHPPDFEAMETLREKFRMYGGPVPSVILDLRQRSQHRSDFTLRHFLHLTSIPSNQMPQSMKATKDRDRVIALLGVATDDAAREIHPNPGISCRDMYILTARVLLRHHHWDIFSLCRRSKESKYNLPSWVPDWSCTMEEPWSLAISEPDKDYNASGPLTTQPGFTNPPPSNPNEIHLDALPITTITTLGPAYLSPTSNAWDWPLLKPYFTALQSFLTQSTRYTASQKLEAEWRIPVADTQFTASTKTSTRAPPTSHMAAGYTRAKALHAWSEHGVARDFFEEVATGFLPIESPYTCYVNQVSRMYNTRPFLSGSGFVGLCPPETRVGDLIVVFAGVKLPYVLSRGAGEKAWRLVGEVYLHGGMDGEVVSEGTRVERVVLE